MPRPASSNLRARHDDPATAQFLTRDTYLGDLTNPASQHLYGYAHNNPTRYTDPSGYNALAGAATYAVGAALAAAGITVSAPMIVFVASAVTVGSLIGCLATDWCRERIGYFLMFVIPAVGIGIYYGTELRDQLNQLMSSSDVPERGEQTETHAPGRVKQGDVVDEWDGFLGPGPYRDTHPRTGQPDRNRIVSGDGQRSIRYGDHEGRAKQSPRHEETWTHQPGTTPMDVNNVVRHSGPT